MRSRSNLGPIKVEFPVTLDSDGFEKAVHGLPRPLPTGRAITFDHSKVEFAPLDVLISALLLYNVLAEHNEVMLEFRRDQPTFGYAARMGLFDNLDDRVVVRPEAPAVNKRVNQQILEMTAIAPGDLTTANEALGHLRTRLEQNLEAVPQRRRIVNDIWTFAAEAVGNIYDHSETSVPGIVAAQLYNSPRRGERLHIVIADGGLGIPATIRAGNPQAALGKSDADLVLKAFRDGVSRRPAGGHGCGLVACASVAARYNANLRVRVGSAATKLITRSAKAGLSLAFLDDDVAPIPGTHLSLDFYLDRLAEVR